MTRDTIKHFINADIDQPKIIIIQNDQKINLSLQEALSLAKSRNLDLVRFQVLKQDPTTAICKILDYKKYIFSLSKKRKFQSTQHAGLKPKSKCIKIRVSTAEGDLQLKIQNLIRILIERYRVSCMIICRGREHNLIEKINYITEKIKNSIQEYGIIESISSESSGSDRLITIRPNLQSINRNVSSTNHAKS